jgi:hypothetical protein
MNTKKIKLVFFDKIEMLSLIFFILALFMADVCLNLIFTDGINTKVPIIFNYVTTATSCFWLGFIAMLFFFLLISFRSIYKRKSKLGVFDAIFGVIGVIGLMLTLSGGLLVFYIPQTYLMIPFFTYEISRITYYHFGIFLDILSIIYFALTK